MWEKGKYNGKGGEFFFNYLKNNCKGFSFDVVGCRKHKNYKDGWWKGRFKFKFKTWNKGTKTRTQNLKSKIRNVLNQVQTYFYCDII